MRLLVTDSYLVLVPAGLCARGGECQPNDGIPSGSVRRCGGGGLGARRRKGVWVWVWVRQAGYETLSPLPLPPPPLSVSILVCGSPRLLHHGGMDASSVPLLLHCPRCRRSPGVGEGVRGLVFLQLFVCWSASTSQDTRRYYVPRSPFLRVLSGVRRWHHIMVYNGPFFFMLYTYVLNTHTQNAVAGM